MLHKISLALSKKLQSNNLISNDNDSLDYYTYGFELFISSILITIIIFTISLFTKSILIAIVFSVSFCTLRFKSGGYHCNKYYQCFLVSVSVFILLLVLCKIIPMNYLSAIIFLAVFLFSIIYISINPTIESSSNPLTKDELKKFNIQKRIILLGLLLAFIILFLLKQYLYTFVITYSVIITMVMIIIHKRKEVENEKDMLKGSC